MATDPISDAIATYITANREDGGMLTNYIVVAEFIDGNGQASWLVKAQEDQNLMNGLALLEFGLMDVKHAINDYLSAIYREEDE